MGKKASTCFRSFQDQSVHISQYFTNCSIKKYICHLLSSHGIGRILDPLKNLTAHFVHTVPFDTFALFTRNFERLGVQVFPWLANGAKFVGCRLNVARGNKVRYTSADGLVP